MSLSGSALAQKTPTTDSINLNSSRSNIYRKGAPGNGQQPPGPAAVTTIKSTKSNGSLKTTQPGKGQPPGPAEGTTVRGSKSNSSD
jgi:hypothetical protein